MPMTLNIAGVDVEPKELVERVRYHLIHGTVWAFREDREPTDGLRRALRDAGGGYGALVDALKTLLTDPDVRVRSGAVALLPVYQKDVGADTLESLLRDQAPLFERVAPKSVTTDAKDLAELVLYALSKVASPTDTAALARLQNEAAKPDGWVLVPGLATSVPDWVCDHATTVLPHDAARGTLRELPTLSYKLRLIDALAPWPVAERDDLLHDDVFWGWFTDDEARDIQKALRQVQTA